MVADRESGPSLAAAALAVTVCVLGCAPRPTLRATAYDVDVRLDPAAHTLNGRTVVHLESFGVDADDDRDDDGERRSVELALNPALVIDDVTVEDATVRRRRSRPAGHAARDGEGHVAPTILRLVLDHAAPAPRVTLDYHGTLVQDVAAGEKEGQVHNFAVSAHVAEEGVYLDSTGYWYPSVELPDDVPPELGLAQYDLLVDPVDRFELVAGAESQGADADGRLHWRSPFPLDGLVLLGGPLVRASRRHGDVELHAVLAPGKDAVAQDILDTAAEGLDRYRPLVGDYPFSEFTVLEAFFSSGFAFPTCTQIVGSQLSERKQYRRHGYLDHELLHNWWGNGILVDPDDGNWCEALATYMGNDYGYVLDGDEVGARKQRRNHSNFLSAIEPDDDKPLGTFGRDDGAGRGIGYDKGAAVFHMLERTIGRDAMFAALRRLTAERMGRYTSWADLQAAFEAESDSDLDWFFDQWVRRGGAPLLHLAGAEWSPGAQSVSVTITQEPTDFILDVPLRLDYGERGVDVVARLAAPSATVEVPCEPAGLTAVELDPDYHLFRKLKARETMPTSSLVRRAEHVVALVPDGELAEGYRTLIDDTSDETTEVVERPAAAAGPEDWSEGGVLVVGDAVRAPAVAELLREAGSPVSWTDAGFAVDGVDYDAPGQAVFFTLHLPDRPGDGITVYYGNSPRALANAYVLGYYANSLLVFDTPPAAEGGDEGDASGMPPTQVVHRADFESHDRIEIAGADAER